MGLFDNLTKRFISTAPSTDAEAISAYKERAYSFEDERIEGKKMTKQVALSSSAVYAAVRLISSSVASLPVNIMVSNDGIKSNNVDHAVWSVLNIRPNNIQTPYEFKELMCMDFLLDGNFYGYIERNKRMDVTAIYRLNPAHVTIIRDGLDKIKFSYLPDAEAKGDKKPLKPRIIEADSMIHIKASSIDGIIGVSPLFYGKEIVKADIEARKYYLNFLDNGANFSGYLQSNGPLKKEQIQSIAEAWKRSYSGANNAHKTPILPSSLEFKQRSLTPQQMMLIEANKFSINDIARLFGVPNHMIGDLERSTNNNIEQQSREFLQYTLSPWLSKIESEFGRKLLKEREKKTTNVDFDTRQYLRATASDRAAYYNTLFTLGAITPNEIRAQEGMNPTEGGDMAFVQVNLVPLKDAETLNQDQSESAEA